MEKKDVKQLYYNITKCSHLFDGCPACKEIIEWQSTYLGSMNIKAPDPALGDITKAKLLFVGKNPSMQRKENDDTPTINHTMTKEEVFQRYSEYINNMEDSYCRHLIKVAEHLGTQEYAFINIVHCKSQGAKGFKSASRVCIDKWFYRILDCPPSLRVIVPMGIVEDYLDKSKLENYTVVPIKRNKRYMSYKSIPKDKLNKSNFIL